MGILEKLGVQKAQVSVRVVVALPGDTLPKIAKREYGDETKWEQIYEANKAKIRDPEVIYPGTQIAIPETRGSTN